MLVVFCWNLAKAFLTLNRCYFSWEALSVCWTQAMSILLNHIMLVQEALILHWIHTNFSSNRYHFPGRLIVLENMRFSWRPYAIKHFPESTQPSNIQFCHAFWCKKKYLLILFFSYAKISCNNLFRLLLPTPFQFIGFFSEYSIDETDLHSGENIFNPVKAKAYLQKYTMYFLEVSLQSKS